MSFNISSLIGSRFLPESQNDFIPNNFPAINSDPPSFPEKPDSVNYRKCDTIEDCHNDSLNSVAEHVVCDDYTNRGFNTCYCVNSLQETDKDGICPDIYQNYRTCDTIEDCHNDTLNSVAEHVSCDDYTNRGFNTCYCVNSLQETDRDGICPDIYPVTHSSQKVRDSGFFVVVDKNVTNTFNRTQKFVLSAEETQTLLQIFIPVSFIITLLAILTLVFVRKTQICHKKKKKDVIIRNNEDIQLLDRMNFVNKNPTYFMTSQEKSEEKKISIKEIPYERVKIIETVGEGAFGHVYKGLYYTPDCPSAMDVAIKILKEGVSNEVKEDFEREVEIMSNFNHDNILSLLGVITKDVGDSPYMIFEYMIHGDLAELLRRNDPVMRKNENDFKLQKNDLIDVALQIANGMKYLTSQHFVHRDLATRNCLVGDGLVVKISDFGMARDVYTHDYYKIGGSRMLPVRWMSPESVKYGCFTNESDIWAYGVVLWEIYSYGRQPYYGHSNEEVVRFLDEGILLQRPEECPYIVYHIMLSCWKTDPKERHSFFRIHKHLTDFSKEILKNSNCSINVTETQDVC